MKKHHYPNDLPLGRQSKISNEYDPGLLRSVSRKIGRAQLGIFDNTQLPFYGEDVWNCWELSWLDSDGKPAIAVAKIRIPAETPHIVESKSLKLYLNSLNMTRLDSSETARQLIARDLEYIVQGPVSVQLAMPEEFGKLRIAEPAGICIDHQSAGALEYNIQSDLLFTGKVRVTETLFSRLIRTNCPITGQPDWATVWVTYTGKQIYPDSLLRYFISFRQHQGFHESCVETMFCHILQKCEPQNLNVFARFTRRGGIDINPFRSTDINSGHNFRDPRQ